MEAAGGGGANGEGGSGSGDGARRRRRRAPRRRRLSAVAVGAVVAECVATARSFVADRVGIDPCPAVRRAAVALQFGIEASHGGPCGVARALAFATRACKAERSGGVRAAILWDARDALLSTPDAPAQLAALTSSSGAGASSGTGTGGPDRHGFDVFKWTAVSLDAARRAGGDCDGGALMRRGPGSTRLPSRAGPRDASEEAAGAVLAGAAQAANDIEDGWTRRSAERRRKRRKRRRLARRRRNEGRGRRRDARGDARRRRPRRRRRRRRLPPRASGTKGLRPR